MLLVLWALAGAPERLVEVPRRVPGVVVELKYATTDNFMKQQVYPEGARCLLLERTVKQLLVAAKSLEDAGFRLKLYDCYRPQSVQAELWKHQPRPGYVMDPKKGSTHSRGTAVDLTLVTLDGGSVEMPSDYDFFGKAAHHRYGGGSAEARARRDLLREAMEVAGFKPNPLEWWHYELIDAWQAAVRDEPL